MNLLVVETPAEVGAWQNVLEKERTTWVVLSIGNALSTPKPNREPLYLIDQKTKALAKRIERGNPNKVVVATSNTEMGNALAVATRNWIQENFPKTKVVRCRPVKMSPKDLKKCQGKFRDGDLEKYKYRLVIDTLTRMKVGKAIEDLFGVNISVDQTEATLLKWLISREDEIREAQQRKVWFVKCHLSNGLVAQSEQCSFIGKAERYKSAIEGGLSFKFYSKTREVNPPMPCNTMSLVKEAGKKWGLTSIQVMTAAEELYESGMITDPYTEGSALDTEIQRQTGRYIRKESSLKYKKRLGEGQIGILPVNIWEKPKEKLRKPRKGTKSPTHHIYSIVWHRTIASQARSMKIEQHLGEIRDDKGRILARVKGGEIGQGFAQLLGYSEMTPLTKKGCHITKCEIVTSYESAPPRFTETEVINKIGEPSLALPVMKNLWTNLLIRLNDYGNVVPTTRGELMVRVMDKGAPFLTSAEFSEVVEKGLGQIARGRDGLSWVKGFKKKILNPAINNLRSLNIIGEKKLCYRTQTYYDLKIHPEGDPHFINAKTGDTVGVDFNQEGLAVPWRSKKKVGFCNKCSSETLVITRWWHGDKIVCTTCGADQ